jgi:hypothetical protein
MVVLILETTGYGAASVRQSSIQGTVVRFAKGLNLH